MAPLVEFKDLVIDAVDAVALGRWWSPRLLLDLEALADGDAVLRGARPEQTIWVNAVPEPKTAKHRVHLDLVSHDLSAFEDTPRLSEEGEFAWTVYADPEGGEFCVFVVPERTEGLKDIVVDAVDHAAIATWWQELWGGTLGHDDGYTYLDDIPGAPVESFDFVPVPEPKTVENRLHWDVWLRPGARVEDLVDRGARVLRPRGEDLAWTVMADPEGNEFCVFER